ncbi:MAG: FAD-dependent oxidoreductase [Thermodesulfobacteriota bacterium]|nr:FAD-dependent oxidoreductase [Thermodesulfobacteriota bacterium]
MSRRSDTISAAVDGDNYDIAIIGGGINGACLFDLLCRRGYRTILIDKGDFAGGTSQASAMMIWGGLLYLRNLDILSVFNFSRSRDQMIRTMADWISPCRFRFLPTQKGLLSKLPILSAMYLYWVLGCFNRQKPSVEARFPGQEHLIRCTDSLLFEEGMLRCSDCRFVLHWLTRKRPPQQSALNYCELKGGDYNTKERLWHLKARDRISSKDIEICSRVVINCGGVWTDRINRSMNIQSPFKHVFSKGVFIGFQRPEEQTTPLVFAQKEQNDVMLSIPWGPVSLWGPTEDTVTDIERGFKVSADDIRFLLEQYQHHMNTIPDRDDIVSLRCGIRPLAVKKDYHKDEYPLDLSRSFKVAVDTDTPWISVYGGKITGCNHAADVVATKVATLAAPQLKQADPVMESGKTEQSCPTTHFPGLTAQSPTLEWCMEHEHCHTLADYLRRRTNIAQWVQREGLGRQSENRVHLRSLCLTLADGDAEAADRELDGYSQQVTTRFDRILEHV